MFEIILDTMVIKMNKGIKSKEVKKNIVEHGNDNNHNQYDNLH